MGIRNSEIWLFDDVSKILCRVHFIFRFSFWRKTKKSAVLSLPENDSWFWWLCRQRWRKTKDERNPALIAKMRKYVQFNNNLVNENLNNVWKIQNWKFNEELFFLQKKVYVLYIFTINLLYCFFTICLFLFSEKKSGRFKQIFN